MKDVLPGNKKEKHNQPKHVNQQPDAQSLHKNRKTKKNTTDSAEVPTNSTSEFKRYERLCKVHLNSNKNGSREWQWCPKVSKQKQNLSKNALMFKNNKNTSLFKTSNISF